MTAIEQIEAQQAEAKLKARADLLLLADVLAQGEQPPPDALAILTSAGATAEQLEKLVTIAKERLSLEPRAAASRRSSPTGRRRTRNWPRRRRRPAPR